MPDDLDTILAKFADTPERAVQLELVGREFVRAAALYANATTHDEAHALFKGWSEMPGDSLRKAIASHFLDRARAMIAGGATDASKVSRVGYTQTDAYGLVPTKNMEAYRSGAEHPMLAKLRAGRRKTGPAPGVNNMGVPGSGTGGMPMAMKAAPGVHPMIERLRKKVTG